MKLRTRTLNALTGTNYNPATAPAICLLIDYAAQNPGLEFANYGERASFRREACAILRDWQRVKKAVYECSSLGVTDAQVIEAAPRAFSGRLTWGSKQHTPATVEARKLDCAGDWSYCTGQYWPTEYRKAVAAVLEQAASNARASRPARSAMPCTIAELRALNRENGGHWFDRSSMRFFGTRICSGVIHGRYFITRETSPSGAARFSLRSFDETGDVDTVGEFHAYHDKAEAVSALRSHLSTQHVA